MRNRWWAAPGAAAAVALLAACGSSGTSSGASGSSGSSAPAASSSSAAATTAGTFATGITTAKDGSGTVLATAQGRTIYWFAIDTRTKSKCTGACATVWPPVTGKPTMAAGAGLTGKFGTIKRSGGTLQATYDGHPLYLYKGDTAAGQVHGNDVNADGGLWWATTPTGAKLTAAKPAAGSSSSGGSGGYGY